MWFMRQFCNGNRHHRFFCNRQAFQGTGRLQLWLHPYCVLCNLYHLPATGGGFYKCLETAFGNLPSHIKHHQETCGIVKHFIHQCPDNEDPSGHIVFVILDGLNNISGLSADQVDNLLLQKEKFWIGTLCTMHKGMNLTHDWNRTKRCDK